MGIWDRLFGSITQQGPSEEGRIGKIEIGDLLADRTAGFPGGPGIVLLLQEDAGFVCISSKTSPYAHGVKRTDNFH